MSKSDREAGFTLLPKRGQRTAKTAMESLVSSLSHYGADRARRALLGTTYVPPASDRYDLPNIEDADLDQLLKQLELLYKEERERAAETRRRSDQLLTRITATFPLLVAALVYSLPRQSSEANWATLTCASLAILLLLTAFVAIRHNLGKEVHYAPLSGADLEQHGKLRAVNTKNLILEYRVAIIDGEERNDDTIDRLHFSFGLFVAGIFLGLVAGGLAIAHYLAASHPP